MTAMAKKLNMLLDTLDDSDMNEVVRYVEYLVYVREKDSNKNLKIMDEIQDAFYGDKTWKNEDAMLAEMAEFRRSRMS